MGKKVRKKARSAHKEKRAPVSSPKLASEDNNLNAEAVVVDEASEKKERRVCVHLNEGVDLDKVSSKIELNESIQCEDCREGAGDRRAGKGKGKHGKKKGGADSKADSKATWVCLQCGHFSCGGAGLPTIPQSHAVRHARQSRHPLVIQLENSHLRWCFRCNRLIPANRMEETGEEKDVLSNVVKLLKKQPSKAASVDVEDVWFGSGSVVSDIKSETNGSDGAQGTDFYVVRGIVNLGNTCFFNSVMQNLLAMDKLRENLLKLDGSIGPLTSALRKTFVEARLETGLRNVINPKSLFGSVCARAPQFRGFHQQDSHELLRCLLDGLSTEEICAQRSENTLPGNERSPAASPTFVDAIFGGQLSSTVCCVECGHSSVVYEPFLDLSLPVPTKKSLSKKAQLGSRARKTKLPPKRGGKTRVKSNRDGNSISAQGISNPSSSSDSSCRLKSAVLPAEKKEASSGGGSSADRGSALDGNDSVSHYNDTSTAGDFVTMEESQDAAQNVVPVSDYTWLDYLQPGSVSNDQDLVASSNDPLDAQDDGNKDDENAASSHVVATSSSEVNVPESSFRSDLPADGWGDEQPLQVQGNEILLLPYKEDSDITMGGMEVVAEVPSSDVVDGEDSLGFDGLGDLFNEPEAQVGPSVKPSAGASGDFDNGFPSENSSESDPGEVDNTDSPVSIESCLAHFTKPELLSNEHAWHCENCSKVLLEETRKSGNNKPKTTSGGQKKLQYDMCSDNNGERTSQPPVGGSTTGLAGPNNGTSETNISLGKINSNSINGFHAISTETGGENCEAEDAHPSTSCTSHSSATSDQAYTREKLFEPRSAFSNHDVSEDVRNVSEIVEDWESGEDEEEVDSKSLKVMRDATKRILIDRAPPVLTIHLKRFSQDARGRLSKLSGHVVFKEVIDLGPFMDARGSERGEHIYQLVGVVEHYGNMKGGHYIAYVRGGHKSRAKSDEGSRHSVWYYVSDASVCQTTLEEVLHCEAYILFYEKV